MSPHFMSYNRLFYHCYIILSFYNDYKILNNELNEKNGISNSKDNIEKNKSRSNQIKPNLNGYGHHEKNKEKERDKSVDKIRERDKYKEKNHK